MPTYDNYGTLQFSGDSKSIQLVFWKWGRNLRGGMLTDHFLARDSHLLRMD